VPDAVRARVPAILLDRYGADGFGTISGILSTPVTIAKAVGPLGGAALAEAFGYRPLILTVAAACLIAAIALGLTRRLPATERAPEAEHAPETGRGPETGDRTRA
jgi:MFS family permease